MPSTVPFTSPVDIKESTEGRPIWKTDLLPSSVPIVNNENGAPALVSYRASAAAIFIGCCSVMIRAVQSPVTPTIKNEIIRVAIPVFNAGRATSSSRPLIIIHPATPANSAPAVMNAEGTVWRNAATAVF